MKLPPPPPGYFMEPPRSENRNNSITNTGSGLSRHEEPFLPPLPGDLMGPSNLLPPLPGYLMEPPNPLPPLPGDLMGPSNILPPPHGDLTRPSDLLPSPPGHLMGPPGLESPKFFSMGQPISLAAAGVQPSENAARFNFTMPVENSSSALKKRRGRPKKNNLQDLLPANLAPMPISSSVPFTPNFGYQKRGRDRGSVSANGSGSGGPNDDNLFKKPHMNRQMSELDPSPNDDEGPNLRTHTLTVNAGEDVMWKIMKFAQRLARSICILSAVGPISSVNLRPPMRSDDSLAYEGPLEIVSLTGSYIPSKNGVTPGRGGGMSVSLARPDGSTFGGRLADYFIAAGPVWVVIGNLGTPQKESEQPQQQIKKERREGLGSPATTPFANISSGGSEEDPNARYRLNMPFVNSIPSATPVAVQPVPVPTPPVSFSHGPSTGTVYHPTNSMMPLLTSYLPRVDNGEEFGVRTDPDSSGFSS